MPRTRKARTQKKHKKVLSIPELRSSMEYINNFAHKLAQSKASLSSVSKSFASEWKRVFGKQLSYKASEDFMKNILKLHKHGKTRRHRGGSYGAPLDHLTRAGADLPYGNYPTMVTKGFWTPEPAILQNAKMNGGGLLNSLGTSLSAASFRPVIAQNPLTLQGTGVLSWKGLPTGPGGAAYENPNIKV